MVASARALTGRVPGDQAVGGGRGVRSVVAESWLRSSAAGVDPDAHLAPVVLDTAHLADHSAFGGYTQSGIGRETHKMMLEHYQQTKNLLVSYSPDALGFF